MSINKVAIHAVWGTKNRYPFLTDEIRLKICKHIFANAKENKIYIDTIDGYTEHLHCLFYLNPTISLSKTMQLIKGESSIWMKKNLIEMKSFAWAVDYYAASVSESHIERVRRYIKNQKAHHQKISFKDEYEGLQKAINSNGMTPD